MKQSSKTLILSSIAVLMVSDTVRAFAPLNVHTSRTRPAFVSLSSSSTSAMDRPTDIPYFADKPRDVPSNPMQSSSTGVPPIAVPQPKSPLANKSSTSTPSPKKSGGAQHKRGVFSPVVLLSKKVLGEEKLNKLRAKVISLHSDVIAGFVDTYETTAGRTVLKQLFELADRDNSGTIEQHELQVALQALGFEWLQDKQVSKIFERADTDANGAIDLDEWMREAPKTLRTNLIKLAKKNGDGMGLLV